MLGGGSSKYGEKRDTCIEERYELHCQIDPDWQEGDMCGPRGLVGLFGRMKKISISTCVHFSSRVYTGKPGSHAGLSMWS